MLLARKTDFPVIAYIVSGWQTIKLECISLIIGSVDFLVGVIMLRVVNVKSVEISIGLKTIGAAAISSVKILMGVIVIKVIVID